MTLIYGCMGLGGTWDDAPFTAADVDLAERAVHAALDIGISWFDHADIYRNGKAEQVFGEVLRRDPALRDRVRIQTKCGIRLGENGLQAYYDLSKAAILQRVDGSLRRLGVERVDVLLLHRPDPLMDPVEVADAYGELRAAGKVGALGVSNMSAAQMSLLQRHLDEPLAANQLEMSLHRRDWLEAGVLVNHPEGSGLSFPEGTVEYCRANGVRIQAWGSLAQGIYSGARRSEADNEAYELVNAMAAEKGTTAEAIVLGWLMRHPARIEPVLGTANPDRIRACGDAAAQAAAMTNVEWYRLWTAARGNAVP
ncbi:aldo/keto reductase [Kutzneria kofuensis]|uniref:Putative oxidoreductase n=1 Tax=Kutzneria kofuensis TaxID=103725 RepID=A0A7W9KA45_9PSEU|nr:aldo/keto reductase [Kutzneria kofuensis]MBB5888842.1 putative oxidoreductase [Kutzneria kofuensis]